MRRRAYLSIGLGVLLLVLAGCNIQQSLLYYPGYTTISEVEDYVARNDLRMWPGQGGAYQGIVSRNGPAVFKGTIVVFHGNAGPAMYRDYYMAALERRGYRVVLAEYPGYGGRPGELSEKSLVADARRTVLRAGKDFGGPVYLWGESMGCGIAAALAADPEIHPQGIIMLTPWDSLLNIGKAKFPWLPVRLLLKDTYDNGANLSNYKGPVAVIMAKDDEVIPNRLTERLYSGLPQPKRLWVFERGGHNGWPRSPELQWWDEVVEFLNSNWVRKRCLGR